MSTPRVVPSVKAPLPQKVAIIGTGKIATILVQAMFNKGVLLRDSVQGTVHQASRVEAVQRELGIRVSTDNVAAVREADVILLCVKPQVVETVLKEIREAVRADQLMISVAASVPSEYIERRLPVDVAVLRAMPNTPAAVNCGVTAICRGAHAGQKHLDYATTLFSTVGRAVVVDEKHMDAVTGLSGSGPAFIYTIIESLADAGVKTGLPRDLATLLAAQTTMGAAKMVLESGDHPAVLKEAVTTPAGCTIDGLLELEEGGLRVTLIKAVVKAAKRAKELVFS